MKLIFIFLIISMPIIAEDGKKNQSHKTSDEIKNHVISYSNLKDTLYTLGDYFIEVNLSNQMAYLHSRFDSTKAFGISSGTARLKDGMDTNEGVYAIQFKVERWHSIQFDSTLMLNFMTFNWGIGFHALAGNSYYKYLGVKRSSHGCVRVSRENARDLYQKVKYGTPVIVHKGNPAVFIAFANQNDAGLKYLSYPELKNTVSDRLQKLYSGEYLLSAKDKLLIDNNNVTHSGLPIGDGKKINRIQKFKPDYLFVEHSMPGIKEFNLLNNNTLIPNQLVSIRGRIPEPSEFVDD